jgi:hypothetical protein
MQIQNQKEIIEIEDEVYKKLQPAIEDYIDRITREDESK